MRILFVRGRFAVFMSDNIKLKESKILLQKCKGNAIGGTMENHNLFLGHVNRNHLHAIGERETLKQAQI